MSTGLVASLIDTRPSSTPGYLGTLNLTAANGYVVQSIDPGFPETRAVVDNVTDGDGTFDYTQNYGARSLTIAIGLAPEKVAGSTNQKLIDALRAYMHPRLRPVCRFQLSAADSLRQVSMRADQSSFVDQYVSDEFDVITCGWRVPSGVIEAASVDTVSASPASLGGRRFPHVFPHVYPSAGSLVAGVATNLGNESVDPLVRVYGPATGPSITHVETGLTVALTRNGGADIADGDFVDIDFRARTVQHSDGSNLYNTLAVPAQWWRIFPGTNHLTFAAVAWSGSAHADVVFRSAWI